MSSLRLRTAQQPDGAPDNSLHSSSPPSTNNESIIDGIHKKRRTKVTSTRTILITMLTLSTCMLLSSSRLHSRLSGRLLDHTSRGWGWEPRLRRRPYHDGGSQSNVIDDGSNPGRLYYHHPRVISNIDNLPISIIQSKQSFVSRMYSYFLSNPVIVDPMLHHDEWTGDYETDEISSWWVWLLDFKLWSSDENDIEPEDDEGSKKCVPMAEWQTTSYPNCNVGKTVFPIRF